MKKINHASNNTPPKEEFNSPHHNLVEQIPTTAGDELFPEAPVKGEARRGSNTSKQSPVESNSRSSGEPVAKNESGSSNAAGLCSRSWIGQLLQCISPLPDNSDQNASSTRTLYVIFFPALWLLLFPALIAARFFLLISLPVSSAL